MIKIAARTCGLALILTTLAAGSGLTQTVVGRAIVDGERVELYSDKTWRFENEPEPECKALGLGVSFCGDANRWAPSPPPTADIAAQYRFDDRHYGQYILEGLGVDDGITTKFMSDAVIQNAAGATGVTKADIPVLDSFDSKVNGFDATTIVYGLRFDQLDVVFVNTIVVLPKRTIQALTFAVGTDYSDMHKELNAEFLSLTTIEPRK